MRKMFTSQLLFLISMVITTSECSERATLQCVDLGRDDPDLINLLEGEAYYVVPYALDDESLDEEMEWYKNNSEKITTDETEDVHYHGGGLFFLNPCIEDSGLYRAREHEPSGRCYNYYIKVSVFKASPVLNSKLLYGQIKNSDENKLIRCPGPVIKMCKRLNGTFTWEKDSKLLQGLQENEIRIEKASRRDEGIYTCICTWTHSGKEFKSSGSRRLILEETNIHREVIVISPTNKEQLAEEGVGIKLNCSIFCGTNVKSDCKTHWEMNFNQTHGYSQTTETVVQSPSNNTISTAILTIEKVSAKDFKAEFTCKGSGFFTTLSASLVLKRRASIIPLVIGGVCALLICVLAAALVKCFAINLTLFFRPCIPLSIYKKDSRVYDAYVVYQMQSMNKVTEDTLCQFVTKTLPSVLEEKCGYRLFIHGRDDIPGEDRLELVEDRMKQSRRLMVILTPGSESDSESVDQHPGSTQNPLIGGFDWQVGLHHALLQREMSVILIQLGSTGPQGYTHLPIGLQHLIQKSAPIRWPEGSRGAAAWNSRFWKRVRYLMPATPAIKYQQSAII